MLSQNQLQNVCMAFSGDHRMCRYLRDDELNYGVYYCYKHRPNEKKKIDLKVREFIREQKAQNKDPAAQGIPLGDNCQGYPVLKVIQQGYDYDP